MTLAAPHGSFPDAQARWGNHLLRTGTAELGVIWASVLAISLFSPDLVTGSEQAHTPIAAVLTWMWGLIATRSVVTTLAAQREHPEREGEVRALAAGTAALWLAATATSVLAPVTVTGADPTEFPAGAILAPLAALLITTTANQLFTSLHRH